MMSDIKRLSVQEFVRTVGVSSHIPHTLFLGAGTSISSGMPSAQSCIWEWKREIFLTHNPGLKEQFAELSLPYVQERIQRWLDEQGEYPKRDDLNEYGTYIGKCYPLLESRRAYFQKKVQGAMPHIGYKLLSLLAELDLLRIVWTTNFDALLARAAASFQVSPVEVGIDSQNRILRQVNKGELASVYLHGDYRYDFLKNTDEELQKQEATLRASLVSQVNLSPFIVCGYSGRDRSIMDAFKEAYSSSRSMPLFWCGMDGYPVPSPVTELLAHANAAGNEAFYIPTNGFDDLMIRLAYHFCSGSSLARAQEISSESATADRMSRSAYQVRSRNIRNLVKTNVFPIDLPSEFLTFDLKKWPENNAWQWLRDQTNGSNCIAVPLRGHVVCLGSLDIVKDKFRDNIAGDVTRTPLDEHDLQYENGAITSLLLTALLASIALETGLRSEGHKVLVQPNRREISQQEIQRLKGFPCMVYDAIELSLRLYDGKTYLALMPTIRVTDLEGNRLPDEKERWVKLTILSNQYNIAFNTCLFSWANMLTGNVSEKVYEWPPNCASTFRFRVGRSPVVASIDTNKGQISNNLPSNITKHIGFYGIQVDEPVLLFGRNDAKGIVEDVHPIRGVSQNRPYDYLLTDNKFCRDVNLGIICPAGVSERLRRDLSNLLQSQSEPLKIESDYLIRYPGFQQAFNVGLSIPSPGQNEWQDVMEPSSSSPKESVLEAARLIIRSIEALRSTAQPSVVLIYIPMKWAHLRRYESDTEVIDLHDYIKAYCVQKGIPTQFLEEDTLISASHCRIAWWLSLALYVKSMRTPWVLKSLDNESAYVGLGFSQDTKAEKGRHIVLGCSHIYSAQGEGLQYRLSQIEEPIIKRGNPFMSHEDARRTGESIRQLFYERAGEWRLPRRVVIHKQTPFIREEREGLMEGLSGVEEVEMVQINFAGSIRGIATRRENGSFTPDGFPVRRGVAIQVDKYSLLLWNHGVTDAVNPSWKYYQGKRRIPAPLLITRNVGTGSLERTCSEVLALSKMDWNSFDLYAKLPSTIWSSSRIAKIGKLLHHLGPRSYDYRLFI